MGPKKNPKAIAANERKAEADAESKGKKLAAKEALVAQDWAKGTKDSSRRDLDDQKKQDLAAKKAERDRLLADEEASLPSKSKPVKKDMALKFTVEEYGATGIDNALDLLNLTTAKSSDKIERHPERRMKSAYAAFEEENMPILKADNPGLRLTQLKQALQKKWKKAPENPMNQAHVAHDATREETKDAQESLRSENLAQFRTTQAPQ